MAFFGESGLLGTLAIPLIDLAINLPKVVFNHNTKKSTTTTVPRKSLKIREWYS